MEDLLSEVEKVQEGDKKLVIKEPYKGEYDLVLTEIPVSKMEVIVFQRKPSKAHVKNLINSISKLGFVVPLVVAKKPDEDKYVILDGQHRFLAALDLGIRSLPVVVVPWEISKIMINLNTEKQPNVKEKSYVALRVYKEILKEKPDMMESDEDLLLSVEQIYYVTFGMVYEHDEKFSAASWEPITKKTDWPFEKPLQEAVLEREKRAQLIFELHLTVKRLVEKLKEMQIEHPFIYKEVVSKANPIKRKRILAEFDEVFAQIKEKLQEWEANPEELKNQITGEFAEMGGVE